VYSSRILLYEWVPLRLPVGPIRIRPPSNHLQKPLAIVEAQRNMLKRKQQRQSMTASRNTQERRRFLSTCVSLRRQTEVGGGLQRTVELSVQSRTGTATPFARDWSLPPFWLVDELHSVFGCQAEHWADGPQRGSGWLRTLSRPEAEFTKVCCCCCCCCCMQVWVWLLRGWEER